jgi:translocation and assembly module TamA
VSRRACVLALLVACGGSQATHRSHKPGSEYLVGIRIDGAKAIDPSDLIPRLALDRTAKREGSIDEYQLQLDSQRIATAYQKLGFFKVDVTSRLDKHGDAATLVFVVKEGPRATTHVEFAGLPPEVAPAKARAVVGVAEGAPFDYAAFDDAKEPLLALVENAGYAHARVVGNVLADRTASRATLRYTIDPGPRSTFGDITLVGATGPLADAIRDRLKFAPGMPYSRTLVDATEAAIYQMGLFASVRVDPDQESLRPTVDVKISVTLVTKNEISAGGGIGLDPVAYSLRARGQYQRRGFVTPLTTLRIDLKPELAFETATCNTFYEPWTCSADFRGRAVATVIQQDFLFPDVKADVEAGVDYLVYEAYAKLGAHGRLGVTAPLGTPRLQLRLGWQYEAARFESVYIDPVDAHDLGIDHDSFVGAYTGAVVLDLRNTPVSPRYGGYAELRAAWGTPAALGGYDYVQLTPEVRGFVPLGPFVLALRARVGTITGNVPATERYYGGGTSSMRGFGQRGLSPVALTDYTCDGKVPCIVGNDLRVIGGAGLIETSAELRTPPFLTIRGVGIDTILFLDGGNVTRTASELDPFDQYWAVGFGLRVPTAIGPLGAELGIRINRLRPSDGWTARLNPLLVIGEAF